ncbi:MAG TPA: S9 family peptidase [Lacunisphaera sp.]|nr:S9 family peptidase [Lacunisphaera sp.]
MPRRLPVLLAVLALAGAAPRAASEPAVLTATDLFKVNELSTPVLSPDGRWVAYVVKSFAPKPGATREWTYASSLWLAATDGATPPRRLTFGATLDTSPAWDPHGRRIAFVRTVEKEKPQLFLLDLVAGGEARPLTHAPDGATDPLWSPDGRLLLYTSSLTQAQVRAALEKAGLPAAPPWPDEKPGRSYCDVANWAAAEKNAPDLAPNDPDGTLREVREWLARHEAAGNPRVVNRLNFLGEGEWEPDLTFHQLFTIEPREDAAPVAVAPAYIDYAEPAWLADGTGVVCVGPRHFDQSPEREHFRSIYSLPLAGGAPQTVLGEEGYSYNHPTPSPDGKWLAYLLSPGDVNSFVPTMVAVIPAGGGQPRILTPLLDRAAGALRWAADSTGIYFTAPSHGHIPLDHVSLADGKVEAITRQNDWGIDAFDVGAHGLVEIVTHPGNPWELHAGSLDGGTVHALTTHNASWLKERRLSAYEPHSLVTKDGLTVDFWTLKPAAFDPARKYPLLVQIHGGPAAMWGPGEASTWFELQYFAARGYAVVFCNPRGSGGYGQVFARANYRDWGEGPADDVLAAADFAARQPFVDRQRQVVTGGSYGGYLTAWIVGHDHRFKAAIAQRGVYDLATFYGEGNAWWLLPKYWGGFPWEPEIRHHLDRDSPLTYVDAITTPLLIEHGDADFRTGFVQSQILYKALKQLGRPVEYARYPHATHELSRSGDPQQRLDRLVRFEEFFRRHIGEN